MINPIKWWKRRKEDREKVRFQKVWQAADGLMEKDYMLDRVMPDVEIVQMLKPTKRGDKARTRKYVLESVSEPYWNRRSRVNIVECWFREVLE